MGARKSPLMRAKEAEFEEEMETLLPRLVNQMGNVSAAAHLGITHGTVNRWLLILGYVKQVVPAVEHEEAWSPQRDPIGNDLPV